MVELINSPRHKNDKNLNVNGKFYLYEFTEQKVYMWINRPTVHHKQALAKYNTEEMFALNFLIKKDNYPFWASLNFPIQKSILMPKVSKILHYIFHS